MLQYTTRHVFSLGNKPCLCLYVTQNCRLCKKKEEDESTCLLLLLFCNQSLPRHRNRTDLQRTVGPGTTPTRVIVDELGRDRTERPQWTRRLRQQKDPVHYENQVPRGTRSERPPLGLGRDHRWPPSALLSHHVRSTSTTYWNHRTKRGRQRPDGKSTSPPPLSDV